MKFIVGHRLVIRIGGRAPQGARGLKWHDGTALKREVPVAPRKGRED